MFSNSDNLEIGDFLQLDLWDNDFGSFEIQKAENVSSFPFGNISFFFEYESSNNYILIFKISINQFILSLNEKIHLGRLFEYENDKLVLKFNRVNGCVYRLFSEMLSVLMIINLGSQGYIINKSA